VDEPAWAALENSWRAVGLPEARWLETAGRLRRYRDLIAEHNEAAGLMGPSGLGDFPLKHVADSLSLLAVWPPPGPIRLADVGAGAGLPGVVLALALPELHLTAIETNGRKASFLARAAEELGLSGRAEVVCRQVREVDEDPEYRAGFDLVTARAFAPADRCIRHTRHLLGPEGALVLYKTPGGVAREISAARREAGRFGLAVKTSRTIRLPGETGTRQFLRVTRPRSESAEG
jgi:16S rRNA (guanine527-N7)-methyltransferase